MNVPSSPRKMSYCATGRGSPPSTSTKRSRVSIGDSVSGSMSSMSSSAMRRLRSRLFAGEVGPQLWQCHEAGVRQRVRDDKALDAPKPAQAVERRTQRRRHPYAVDLHPVALVESLLADIEAVARAQPAPLRKAHVHVEVVVAPDVGAVHPGGRQPAEHGMRRKN